MIAATAGRLLTASAWLFGAQLVLGGLSWALLITPESNVLMLSVSTALLLFLLAAASLAVAGTIGLWSDDGLRGGLRRPLGAVAAGVVGVVLFAVIRWIAGVALDRLMANEAGISAWLIARLGWADATPLFTAAGWVAAWVRWVVAPLLACSAFAAWRAEGPGALARAAWLRRALSPVGLITTSAAVYLLVYWPWQWVDWRPSRVPATWVEPAAAAAKLAVILLAMSVAWAWVVRVASRRATVSP